MERQMENEMETWGEGGGLRLRRGYILNLDPHGFP